MGNRVVCDVYDETERYDGVNDVQQYITIWKDVHCCNGNNVDNDFLKATLAMENLVLSRLFLPRHFRGRFVLLVDLLWL